VRVVAAPREGASAAAAVVGERVAAVTAGSPSAAPAATPGATVAAKAAATTTAVADGGRCAIAADRAVSDEGRSLDGEGAASDVDRAAGAEPTAATIGPVAALRDEVANLDIRQVQVPPCPDVEKPERGEVRPMLEHRSVAFDRDVRGDDRVC